MRKFGCKGGKGVEEKVTTKRNAAYDLYISNSTIHFDSLFNIMTRLKFTLILSVQLLGISYALIHSVSLLIVRSGIGHLPQSPALRNPT